MKRCFVTSRPGLAVVKDSRLSVLLPFWRTVVPAAFSIGASPATIEKVAAVVIDVGLRHRSNREPMGSQSERSIELYELLRNGIREELDHWCETGRAARP